VTSLFKDGQPVTHGPNQGYSKNSQPAHCPPIFSVALREGKLCHTKKKSAHDGSCAKPCNPTNWLGYF